MKDKKIKEIIYGYSIPFVFVINIICPFILPKDAGSGETGLKFVNFMKQFFPNIEYYQSISTMPNFTAFFTSVSWVITIFCMFGILMRTDYANKVFENFRFFSKSILLLIGIFMLGKGMSEATYTGKMISVFYKNKEILINSVFQHTFIGFLQSSFYFGVFCLVNVISCVFYGFKNLKKGKICTKCR